MSNIVHTKTFPRGSFQFFEIPGDHASQWSFTDEDSVRHAWWHFYGGEVLLDIGCAYGSYSMPALAMGAAKVIAWSPQDYKDKFLANAELNNWQDKVEFHDLGLWSQAGWLEIFDDNGLPRFFTEKPPHEGIIFPVKALDDYQFDRVDWMKLDVEGCEVEALRGALETIRKHKPKIVVENHLFKDGSINQKCEDMIRSSGVAYQPRQEMPYHSVSHSLFVPVES